MQKAAINEERIYLINRALHSIINQKLTDIDEIITHRGYSLDHFINTNKLTTDNISLSNEAYILFYLKYQTIRIYKELRSVYKAFLNNRVLTDEELMFKYFRESIESLSIISNAERVESLDSIVILEKPKSRPEFNDRRYDFLNQKKGVLTYEQMVKNPKLFSVIEEYLYENEIIDQDFIFRESAQGMTKLKFAALVHQMNKLNYFNKILPNQHKKIDDIEIRRFINHRYQTDIDRQYRELRNDEEKLKEIIKKDTFIENIGGC